MQFLLIFNVEFVLGFNSLFHRHGPCASYCICNMYNYWLQYYRWIIFKPSSMQQPEHNYFAIAFCLKLWPKHIGGPIWKQGFVSDCMIFEDTFNFMFCFVFFCFFPGVGSTSNSVPGIDAMCPSSKEDFTEFEKLLKEKISQFEKSVHYSSFLDSLFRELCISCKCSFFYIRY